MTWVRHNAEERAEHLPDLLAAVRLPLISSKYLVDHIEKVCILTSFRFTPLYRTLLKSFFSQLQIPTGSDLNSIILLLTTLKD